MKKRIFALLAALCLLSTGCGVLLDRSYSAVEPYTDRFWDTSAEDTLKAENYQDLVNSLLMLVEQRSEEGVIRYYVSGSEDSYTHALRAKREVQNETILGSYLLESISVNYSISDEHCTLTYYMTYRDDAQDIASLMALSDTQSLVDLLRVSVREEHGSLTAQFISKTSRSEVLAAVDSLWEELYLKELEASGALAPSAPTPPPDAPVPPEEGDIPSEETPETPSPDETSPDETSPDASAGETAPPDAPPPDETTDGELPPDGSTDPIEQEPTPPEIQIPPCPWTIRFYPDTTNVEIVEIILR